MPLTLTQVLYAYSIIPEVGPVTLTKIIKAFPDPNQAWQANYDELLNIAQLPPKIIVQILKQRPGLDPLSLWEELQQNQIKVITVTDQNYPYLLRQIYTPPPLLTYRGQLPQLPYLAIVGTRHCTNYGRAITQQLTSQLMECGITVVSGLARGIDAIAHQTAVRNHGKTIAIIGTGLAWNIFYPYEHRPLAEDIINNGGCIMSELAYQTPALPANFPRRNRLISGIASATLVIEGDVKSGAMITAKWALEQNREVLAIPGPINNPASSGPNWLIKNGAVPVLDVRDILICLGLETINTGLAPAVRQSYSPTIDLSKLSSAAQKIFHELTASENVIIDQLCQKLNLPANQGSIAITELELKGLITREGVMIRRVNLTIN